MTINVSKLPKVELHCHIDGILDPSMLEDMERANIPYPITSQELQSIYPNNGIEGFIRWFDLVDSSFHKSFDSFKPILERHIERLKDQNVIYVEIFVGRSEIPRDDVNFLKNIEDIIGILRTMEDRKIQIELVYQFGRNRAPEQIGALSDWIIKAYKEDFIVGVAMAGLEKGFPVRPFANVFRKFMPANG